MDFVTGIFAKKQPKETWVPLPPIDPLETKADITGVWEAVERFPECLLLTEPILSDKTEDYKVKNVVFTIMSNDQGWCNEDNFTGEYEGSWTWFEVAILRPVEKDTRISPRDKRNITSEPCIKKHIDERGISDNLCFFIKPEDGSPFWHLQRNRRGNDEPFPHTVTWNWDGKESETESLGWDFDAKTGAGSGVNFVPSLQKGDRVAIIARAKQSGSVNYILEARIQIHFEGFKLASITSAVGLTQDLTNSEQSSVVGRSDPAKVLDAPAVGQRKPSSSISDAKPGEPSAQPDVIAPHIDVPPMPALQLPSSKPTSNTVVLEFPQATSSDAAGAQVENSTQKTVVGGGPLAPTANSSIEIARPAVRLSVPETRPSDADLGSPMSPKSPADASRKGGARWSFRLPGGNKKANSNMITKLATDDNTQAISGDAVSASSLNVNVEFNDEAGPLASDDLSGGVHLNHPPTPSSPVIERSKSFLGRLGDKVPNVGGKRGKT